MATEDYKKQWNTPGDTSTLRKRKNLSENTPLSKDAGRWTQDDPGSSNGTLAECHGSDSNNPPATLLLLLVVASLSFSTRFHRLSEPSHVWWAFCKNKNKSFMAVVVWRCLMQWRNCAVPAGMKRTLERWEATTSTEASSSMFILLLEKWENRFFLFYLFMFFLNNKLFKC